VRRGGCEGCLRVSRWIRKAEDFLRYAQLASRTMTTVTGRTWNVTLKVNMKDQLVPGMRRVVVQALASVNPSA